MGKYVDESRKAHYLDGYAGEYILPNVNLYTREAQLYADVQADESGDPTWSDPTESFTTFAGPISERLPPPPLDLVGAMSALGLFTPKGLRVTSEIWEEWESADQQDSSVARALTRELIMRLDREGLPGEEATDQHARPILDFWQLPMYNLDFDLLNVPRRVLEAERASQLWQLL